MLSLLDRPAPAVRAESHWTVALDPPVLGDFAWRERLLTGVRAQLEQALARDPRAQSFEWGSGLLRLRVERESGEWRPGGAIRLRLIDAPSRSATGSAPALPEGLPSIVLPDDRLAALAERLVGLDGIAGEVLTRLHCQWGDRLADWSALTGHAAPRPLLDQLKERTPLFLFAGDPGTGKSALAQVVADRYCRETASAGRVLFLTTAARGNGLVGDFGNRVRAAFAAATQCDAPGFLIIDEADAVAMRRSEAHSHQEDRAGTATLLQCLDQTAPHQRLAVFLTSNLEDALDPAVRRRGTLFRFERPDPAARSALLAPWLPEADARQLKRAATAAQGMTPADIERALVRLYLSAIAEDTAPTVKLATRRLRRGERTGSV